MKISFTSMLVGIGGDICYQVEYECSPLSYQKGATMPSRVSFNPMVYLGLSAIIL